MMGASEQRSVVLSLVRQVRLASAQSVGASVRSLMHREALWQAQWDMHEVLGGMALPLLATTVHDTPKSPLVVKRQQRNQS